MAEPLRRYVKPAVFLAVILCLAAIARYSGVAARFPELRSWIEGFGFWGPLVFSAVFALGAVALVPGSALSIAAGAMFGSLTGTAAVSIGSTAGAGLSFLIARYAARSSVEKMLGGNDKLSRLDALSEKHGAVIVAITRLVPLFPYTLLNYGFGLTKVRFSTYLFWSWLCMLPGTVLYVAGSDVFFRSVSSGRVPKGVAVVFVIFAVILYFLIRFAKSKLDGGEGGKK